MAPTPVQVVNALEKSFGERREFKGTAQKGHENSCFLRAYGDFPISPSTTASVGMIPQGMRREAESYRNWSRTEPIALDANFDTHSTTVARAMFSAVFFLSSNIVVLRLSKDLSPVLPSQNRSITCTAFARYYLINICVRTRSVRWVKKPCEGEYITSLSHDVQHWKPDLKSNGLESLLRRIVGSLTSTSQDMHCGTTS